MKKIIAILAGWGVLACAALACAGEKVAIPKGYEKWEKSSEKVVSDKNSLFYGIHYIFVDAKALKAYKAGGKYPEGSRFVVEFYDIRDEAGKPAKGKKNMVVLMKRDKKQTATGGWLFAGFSADGKPSGVDPVKNCFDCHQKEAREREFVISRFENFKK